MATSGRSFDETVCQICAEVYKDPRVLSCGHTFCYQCIVQLKKRACPYCRSVFTLPADGVHGLPKNYALLGVLEMKEFDVNAISTGLFIVKLSEYLINWLLNELAGNSFS